MATYPRSTLGRLEYWRRQIKYAEQAMKPLWQASDILQRQYDNRPTTNREKDTEELSDVEPHIARTKANLVFGWIDQSIANLLERNPTFSVTPQTAESTKGAPVVSAISNYWYRETGQKRQDERILLDGFLGPWGVKKLGWHVDVDDRVQRLLNQTDLDFGNEVMVENDFLLTGEPARVTADQDHDFHREAHEALLEIEDLDDEVRENIEDHLELHDDMQDRGQPDPHSDVKWEAPYGQRWDPRDFLIDPLAQDGLRDARWIAFRWKRPIEDVKDNPNYKNTSDLEPKARLEDAPPEDHTVGADDFSLVVGWEIWARNFPLATGKRRNLLISMAEDHDKFLRHETSWPYTNLDDYPAEVLCLQQSSKCWVGKPGLLMAGAESVQGLANEILDSYLSVIRKQKNILLYDPDLLDEQSVDDMLMAPDMSMFPSRQLAEKGAGVQPVQFGQVGNDRGEMLSLITDLFDRSAGTPQPMQRAKVDSATEASIAERRTTAREARRGNLMAEMQINTARKFWQMTTQFRPEKAILIHPDADEWVQVDDAIARGEYRFRIDVSSQAAAIALERKNWLDLLNLFAGLSGLFQQTYGQPPNLAAIASRLLTRGYDERAPEEILPMLSQMQDDDTQKQMAELLQMKNQMDALQAPPPGQEGAPSNGQTDRLAPSLQGPPREVTEAGTGPGPALPRQFNTGAPSPSNEMASSETV